MKLHLKAKSNMNYRTVIVDDDRVNIRLERKIISQYFPQIDIVAEAYGVDEAIATINLHAPELLLLDINLGEREVFEIFREINCTAQIVFISSEGKYALNAFRYDATDFVLKPINKEILISAISKALHRLQQQRQVFELGYSAWNMSPYKNFLSVSSVDRHEVLKICDIMYFSSEGRYTIFHTNDGRRVVASKNLSDYEHLLEKLPSFVKISRSQVVNFDYVLRVNKKNGMYCEIIDGTMIPIARRKYSELNKFLSELE